MSILQEYEDIRRKIGIAEYSDIERFLDAHPALFLSDVYYKMEVWNEFKKWQEENKLPEMTAEQFNNYSCACGNASLLPCDIHGKEMEPSRKNGWFYLYSCSACGQIIRLITADDIKIRERVNDEELF